MQQHKQMNIMAIILSVVFLVSYVIYHSQAQTYYYGDLNYDTVLSVDEQEAAGILRYVYYFILISHIILSIFVIPLVLFSFQYAISGAIAKHKKIVKYAYPVWLYVSITGVLVYVMISPYYPQ